MNGTRQPCSGDEHTPKCTKECESSYSKSYKVSVHSSLTIEDNEVSVLPLINMFTAARFLDLDLHTVDKT